MALHRFNWPRELLEPKPRDWVAEHPDLPREMPLATRKRASRQELVVFLQSVIQEDEKFRCPGIIAVSDRIERPTRVEAEIRRMVEAGDISGARDELAKIPVGASKSLDKWKRLLAEPVVKPGRPASGQGMHADLLWLESNSAEYKGQWVALKGGKVLGSNPSSTALEAELAESDCLAGATFFKIEE